MYNLVSTQICGLVPYSIHIFYKLIKNEYLIFFKIRINIYIYYMLIYLLNISYNNRMDTQKLCLTYTKDTLNNKNNILHI